MFDYLLGIDYGSVRDSIPHSKLIYTGPIDEYFGHCFGRLPYRSLGFRFETLDVPEFQGVATVNYPDEIDYPYTRITEFKHLTGQPHPRTSVVYELPEAEGEPYYPIPRPENQALYRKYRSLADESDNVLFVGRLATYRYYNMDQVVAQALSAFGKIRRAESSAKPGSPSAYGATEPRAS